MFTEELDYSKVTIQSSNENTSFVYPKNIPFNVFTDYILGILESDIHCTDTKSKVLGFGYKLVRM